MSRATANRLRVFGCFAVLLLAGCAASESDVRSRVEDFEQNLLIDFDGTKVPIPLDAMDVWLSRRGVRPEPFEIHGDGISIVGTFDPGIRIGYEENWQVLVGNTVTLAARGGNPRYDKPSILTVPGIGQFRVLGGNFTVEKVGPGYDGQTPLTGRIELEIRAATGRKSLIGTFAVLAMTWG
jgi:hypothetical protein